ncbi:MAG TPA: high-potential iron-sulfur protein, partial [Anaerolineae bacterium]|nr:high-potential iron-sulfur protein [Anaerolineae bacterium]
IAEQNSLPQSAFSRRNFLKRAVFIGAAGLMVPGLLSACGNEGAAQRTETASSGNSPEKEANVVAACAATAELSTIDSATRKSLNYVDESPEPEKFCANCRFFKQPEADAVCGGCEIVGGPIAPKGYCNTWVAQG